MPESRTKYSNIAPLIKTLLTGPSLDLERPPEDGKGLVPLVDDGGVPESAEAAPQNSVPQAFATPYRGENSETPFIAKEPLSLQFGTINEDDRAFVNGERSCRQTLEVEMTMDPNIQPDTFPEAERPGGKMDGEICDPAMPTSEKLNLSISTIGKSQNVGIFDSQETYNRAENASSLINFDAMVESAQMPSAYASVFDPGPLFSDAADNANDSQRERDARHETSWQTAVPRGHRLDSDRSGNGNSGHRNGRGRGGARNNYGRQYNSGQHNVPGRQNSRRASFNEPNSARNGGHAKKFGHKAHQSATTDGTRDHSKTTVAANA